MEAPDPEEKIIRNETPSLVIGGISSGVAFVQQWGWFVLIGAVALLYLKKRFLTPRLEQWAQQREDASYKKMDAGVAQSRLEAMERSRQKMQETLDKQAAEYKVKQQEKEEKARQEKIADWDRHQTGGGYRSKTKAPDPTPAI